MEFDNYNSLPDCVWNCSQGGQRALEQAREHSERNLQEKFLNTPKDINRFGEAFHRRFLRGMTIPREVRATGAESCPACGARIICSASVTEHYDTREYKGDGSTDTHWGQGASIEHEFFVEADENQPNCK